MALLRTPEEAKAWLREQGITIQQFACDNDLDAPTLYQVLAGRKLGKRGKAHACAVMLGIKRGVIPEKLPTFASPE